MGDNKVLSSKRTSLSQKVVLITGASSGIGECLAHKFYSSGCQVILAARRLSELERVKRDLINSNPDVATYTPKVLQLDLAVLEELPDKIKEVFAEFGRIDILVNNGGIGHRGFVIDTTIDVDMKIMLINYFASVVMIKAVLPSMVKAKSGHIVCIGSLQSLIGIPNRSSYGASKHALRAFLDTLRAEVKDFNILVSVINPSTVNTSLSKNALKGNGESYGITDEATTAGYTPELVADTTMAAVLKQHNEVGIFSFIEKLALFSRYACPSIFFRAMEARARKIAKL